MNIADAEAAVHKEWEKLEQIAGMASDEGQQQERGHKQRKKKGEKVHIATRVDFVSPQDLGVGSKVPKYKGCVVLCGDVVKDKSASQIY